MRLVLVLLLICRPLIGAPTTGDQDLGLTTVPEDPKDTKDTKDPISAPEVEPLVPAGTAGPDDAIQTTIETIVETVTKTVIREVTDPIGAVSDPEIEATVTPATEVIDNEKKEEEKPIDTVIAAAVPEQIKDEGTVAELGSDAANVTEISGNIRMCSCDESAACRAESTNSTIDCMKSCDNYLQEYGNQTESYLECFSKNTASISEAEDCLFSNLTDYCTTTEESKFFTPPNWKKLTDIKFESKKDEILKHNYLWTRDEKKYDHIQRFYHCTKHCVHRKMHKCTMGKGCGLRMPERKVFGTIMKECTKKNYKIAQSILSTCQCLAWQRGVTDLRGSCVVIGNQFYVDRT